MKQKKSNSKKYIIQREYLNQYSMESFVQNLIKKHWKHS